MSAFGARVFSAIFWFIHSILKTQIYELYLTTSMLLIDAWNSHSEAHCYFNNIPTTVKPETKWRPINRNLTKLQMYRILIFCIVTFCIPQNTSTVVVLKITLFTTIVCVSHNLSCVLLVVQCVPQDLWCQHAEGNVTIFLRDNFSEYHAVFVFIVYWINFQTL